MQAGEYIFNRLLPGMVRGAADSQGLVCSSFSDDWVIRLQKDSEIRWIVGYKFDINPAAAAQIAQDKVAAYQVLSSAGIPAVRHELVRSVASQPPKDIGGLFSGAVVMKPLSGASGRGVALQPDAKRALSAIEAENEPAWALSPYLEIDAELRVIVLDGEIVLAYEKLEPVSRGGLKFFNLGLGAKAAHIRPEVLAPQLASLAKMSASTLGLRLVSVDVVKVAEDWQVLEVNDGLMMENYARQSDENKEHAQIVYGKAVAAMFI